MRETKILCILPKMHLWMLKCSCDSFSLGNSWDQEGWCIVKCDGKTGKSAHLESGWQAAGFGWEKMCCCGICAHGTAPPAIQLPLSGASSCQASQWCTLKTLAQGLVVIFQPLAAASPSALAQAVMWIFHHILETKARLCCLHYLFNLADSSWRSVPAHVVPLAALWLTGQEEINEGLGQCLLPPKRRIASGLRGSVTECKYWIKAAWALF